jgi:hypothetical protein
VRTDKLKDFIKRRADLLGITVDEVMREADTEDKPEFLKAAESRAARQGLSPDEVLQRDEDRLRAPAHPAIEGLMAYEVEEFLEGKPLPPERVAHIEHCITCKALLEARPGPERLEKLMSVAASSRNKTQQEHVRNLVIPWLADPEWSPDKLVSWFKDNIPRLEIRRGETYREILQALAVDPERARWEQELARRVARMLTEIAATPESTWNGDLVTGLLKLSAGLSRGDELGSPLYELWLKCSDTCDLQRFLLAALIENQADRRLEGVWRQLLDPSLGTPRGTPLDGLRGILRMPAPSTEEQNADLDEIGAAIRRIVDGLPEDRSRAPYFDSFLCEIKAARPSALSDEALISLADKHSWPRWAVHRLNLFVEREGTVWLWKHVAATVRRASPDVMVVRLCGGEVFRLDPKGTLELIRAIAPTLERKRMEWKEPDPRACSVVAAECLFDMAEGFHKSTPEYARAMQAAAKELMQEENVGITS